MLYCQFCCSWSTEKTRLWCCLWYLVIGNFIIYIISWVSFVKCLKISFIIFYWSLILCSHTPFANGPEDTPTEILHRIGNSNLDLKSGNWTVISSEAKVRFCCFMVIVCMFVYVWPNVHLLLGFGKKIIAHRPSSKTNSLSDFIKSVDSE